MTTPDASGDIFFQPLESAETLTTGAFGTLLCCTMLAPTGADIGVYGKFNIPQNYSGTPVLVIRGMLGEAANTLAFGFNFIQRAHSETMEIAFETDLINNATWTGLAAEEMYEETITITPATAFVAGDEVFFFFYRDDSVDLQTTATGFHLTGLFFRYSDA